MNDHRAVRRQPYANRVWPSPVPEAAPREKREEREERLEDLPPSARRYGTPTAPPRRLPPWLVRPLIALGVLAAVGAVIAGVVGLVTNLLREPDPAPRAVVDGIAGVTYPLLDGWREGRVAPVTAFTSVVAHGEEAIVMVRPAGTVRPEKAEATVAELTELYAQLLLHGDKVTTLEDRPVTVHGRAGHTRALRADYVDGVNRPAYLRVTLLIDHKGKGTVLLGLAQPDERRWREDIETITAEAR